MAPKLFLTGGTGYIGGTILDFLSRKHPEYEINVLLRNVPENFGTLYPSVRVVQGDYDSHETISKAASEADIVVHAGSSDHLGAIDALISGLVAHPRPGAPRYLIHLSGSGIIADFLDPTYFGRLNPRVWSDVTDIEAITSLPDNALHRPVDKRIQEAAREHGNILKTAIVCPPDVHGRGTGPGKQISIYMPSYFKEIHKSGGVPFYTVDGGNARGWVHIEDLTAIFLKLVESGAAGGKGADWGVEMLLYSCNHVGAPLHQLIHKDPTTGYYFTATQSHTQRAIATRVAEILHKHQLLDKPEPRSLPLETIKAMANSPDRPYRGFYFFASNTRTVPDRAMKVLGWKGGAPDLWADLEDQVLRAWKKD